jgi:predicted membrane channel-forming protein YqfA (hemolysin III family)
MKKFDSPKFRPVRGGMFIFAGLAAVGVFCTILINPSPYKMWVPIVFYSVGGYIFI